MKVEIVNKEAKTAIEALGVNTTVMNEKVSKMFPNIEDDDEMSMTDVFDEVNNFQGSDNEKAVLLMALGYVLYVSDKLYTTIS